MCDNLQTALRRAAQAGVGYLARAVPATGAWPTNVFNIHAPLAGGRPHHPPFVTALGTMALDGCEHAAVPPLVARSRAFLRACMEPGDLWRYAKALPPDSDDTAICSIALGPPPRPAANVGTILRGRDSEGRFRTWLGEPGKLFAQADAVVNANILAYLGDRPETRTAQRWLEQLVLETPEAIPSAIHYYPHPLDLDIALARANHLQAPVLAELRAPVLARVLACQNPDGAFVDILRTAQALQALRQLGAFDRTDIVRPALELLLDAQRPDGRWPACLAWIGGPGYPFAFESAALTTACCVAALTSAGRAAAASAPA